MPLTRKIEMRFAGEVARIKSSHPDPLADLRGGGIIKFKV
jgi:hypothetical protein